MSKSVSLKVTSAFLVDGRIARVGEIVEVSYADAKDLLHRGKAVVAVVEQSAESDKTAVVGEEVETMPAAEDTPAETAKAKSKKGK